MFEQKQVPAVEEISNFIQILGFVPKNLRFR